MVIKTIPKLARVQEWWEHKLPSVLAIGYASALLGDIPLIKIGPWLIFILISIIIGATYVSTINDITDLQEDIDSEKSNRMTKVPKKYRWAIPAICILLGLFFVYIYLPDKLSAFIYILPWISFSLYSFKPFRLKHRGIWGLFADASGAHLFIGLLMVSSISYFSIQAIDIIWLSFVGIWSLCFGLRGILWHQYVDRENDLKIDSKTFATSMAPEEFKKYEKALLGMELIAFSGMLLKISLWILIIFLILYFVLVILRYKVMGYKPVIVINPRNSPLQILMLDFYQVLFPLGILIHMAYTQNLGLVFLLLHLILFPRKLIIILTDGVIIIKLIKKSIQGFY